MREGERNKIVAAKNLQYDTVANLIAYENGELKYDEMVTFFQHLIDTGEAWLLQGHYGRMATHMIEVGICQKVEED